MRGGGGCWACFQSGPISVGGGGGSKRSAPLFPGHQEEPAHGLHPRFVVAEIWADRGYWGGGGVPRRPWIRHVGLWWRQRLVVWVDGLSLAGLGPGGPFGVDVVAGGIRFLVRGGWLVRGGGGPWW